MELKSRDGLARICKFRGVETPTLMPVINPNLIVIPPNEMHERFGVDAIITNSYIIWKNPNLRRKALEVGIHNLLNFEGLIMTDSGTFQQHVYGDVEVDYREIVKFQRDIGSDIGTILDIFTEPHHERDMVKMAIDETARRGKESLTLKGDMLLAGVIQGSVYDDLRLYSAKLMNRLEFDYFAIGGVVPLMEEYRYGDVIRAIINAKKVLNPAKPVHLFGAGHPMFFPLAVLLGVDFFDSAAYIKYARDNRVLFPDGTRHLREIKYVPFYSPIFERYDVDEVKEMNDDFRIRVLAEHNLYMSVREIERVKQAIHEGRMWEYAEIRAREHPRLLEAYREILRHRRWLEKFENISKKSAFFYTGRESLKRPIVYRLQKRLKMFGERSLKISLPRPWSKNIGKIPKDACVYTPFGCVPIELEDIYPVAQSEFPFKEDKNIPEKYDSISLEEFELRKIKMIANYQFGMGAGDALFSGNLKIVKSKNTGKIRNVFVNGVHVASLRADDGFFTLKIEGARRLHTHFPFPHLRVIVSDESAEFNSIGKNVFAKFVLDADNNIRPGDEVLVVDEQDNLIAVGRTLMNRFEMLHFSKGMAVKVREGVAGKN